MWLKSIWESAIFYIKMCWNNKNFNHTKWRINKTTEISEQAHFEFTHSGRWKVHGRVAPLLRSDARVPSYGQATARRATRGRGTGRRYPYLGRHEGVVGQASIGERVADAQEIAVGRGGWPAEPPAAHHTGAGGVFARHVLGTGRLTLIDAQIGNVEGGHMHIVRGELVAQRTVRWRGYGEVVQLQLVPLLPVDVVEHLLQHLRMGINIILLCSVRRRLRWKSEWVSDRGGHAK